MFASTLIFSQAESRHRLSRPTIATAPLKVEGMLVVTKLTRLTISSSLPRLMYITVDPPHPLSPADRTSPALYYSTYNCHVKQSTNR